MEQLKKMIIVDEINKEILDSLAILPLQFIQWLEITAKEKSQGFKGDQFYFKK